MGRIYIGKGPYGIWASDENYQAGGNPWNGNPTKVVPTAGELAQGITPTTPVDSRHLNYALNGATSHAGAYAHAAMRTWRPYLIKLDDGITDADTYAIGGYQDNVSVAVVSTFRVVPYRINLSGNPMAKPALIAMRNLGAGDAAIYLGAEGSHWFEAIGSCSFNDDVGAGGNHTFDINADLPSNIVVVCSNLDRDISVFDGALAIGNRTTVANVAPASHGFSALGSYRANGGWSLFAGVAQTTSTSSRIFQSGDAGQSWTVTTTPAGWNSTPIHAFCATNAEQADDADEIVLATGQIDGQILRSVDDGDTWAVVTLPAALSSRAGWDAYQIAWSPVFRKFLIMNADLDCASSEDGETWTVHPGSGGLSGMINTNMTDRGRLLTAVGPAFVLVANLLGSTGTHRGVLYSFDGGFEWHWVDFGPVSTDNLQQLLGIHEWGGAAVVYSPGKLWTSASIWVPPADFDFS